MLYFVKFHGIKYPMESSFTPEREEHLLCEVKDEVFVGRAGRKLQYDVEPKGSILRPIYEKEGDKLRRIRSDEETALRYCKKRIKHYNLEMKLIGVDKEWSGKRYKFHFLANKRVDFRELVKDLKDKFGCIIELRHIGMRDNAGNTGGIGICGRPLCCSTFLVEKPSVSLEEARDQDIYISPSKISGPCGRLLCCLAYEHEFYKEVSQNFPERGDTVVTGKDESTVLYRNMITRVVTVSYENETQEEISIDEIERKGDKWIRVKK
ncbi:MAG: regulatory iron-sulfur-containing complex subunit RicT [candidate division WOR-3 bacterium]|nr:regulatory iron-sulfur-containing complex subunit RicT [candidate division WOR-3 bacterium]